MGNAPLTPEINPNLTNEQMTKAQLNLRNLAVQ